VQVIATAGHVDHGKSALVRALTGMEPDRWADERNTWTGPGSPSACLTTAAACG
jgi:translation elongation factor EF-Tu-like GTPase